MCLWDNNEDEDHQGGKVQSISELHQCSPKVRWRMGSWEGVVWTHKRGESLFDYLEANFYKGLMVCESRWRLLVFWVPHIHWRKTTFDSSSEASDSCSEAVENLRQTNFQDNIVNSPIDSGSSLGISERIQLEFWFCFKLNSDSSFGPNLVFGFFFSGYKYEIVSLVFANLVLRLWEILVWDSYKLCFCFSS